MRRQGLPREKVLAAVVKLLETTLVRVGNEEYAETNHSFGLTTMRDRHAKVTRGRVHMEFSGKSGVDHEIDISDPKLVKIVRHCQDLPGQELFQYVDEQGEAHDIGSGDVNEYLRQISGHDFTAKDFRTWAGTALAAEALKEFEDFDTRRRQAQCDQSDRACGRAVRQYQGRLPQVLRSSRGARCLHGSLADRNAQKRTERELKGGIGRLPAEEAAVLGLLQQQMKQAMNEDARTRPAPAR